MLWHWLFLLDRKITRRQVMKKIVIAGAGPAGLTCAIYLARAGYDVDVFTDEINSLGSLQNAKEINNYPGFPDGIGGLDLQMKMVEQAEKNGVNFHEAGIVMVNTDSKFVIDSYGNQYKYDEYVEAIGLRHKEYNCNGIENIPVHYCAVCDADLCIGQKVFVIGGGDTAVSSALYLCDKAESVDMVVRKSNVRITNKKAFDELRSKLNFHIWENTTLEKVSLDGEGKPLLHLEVKHPLGPVVLTVIPPIHVPEVETKVVRADHLFVCIGFTVNEIRHVGEGEIWKCGDNTERHKQVAVAVGSGANVALDIIEKNR